MSTANRKHDCIVVGSCVVDLLCRPVSLDDPIGGGRLYRTEPLDVAGGGITINSGVTMARLGMNVGVLTYVGEDDWATLIHGILQREGVDDSPIEAIPGDATSTTVVLIDSTGERSFLHCVGAPKKLTAEAMLDRLPLFAQSRFALFGYYSLMPLIEPRLAEVMKSIRAAGCKTAMDAAGDGGSMDPLADVLPHLDVYVPSFAEAQHQTGFADPRRMIDAYRDCGAPGVLGVKLGKEGVLLSEPDGGFVEVPIVEPPGEVVDTTGAGDSFYAGLLTGLIRGMSLEDAGKLGTAAAACCVTTLGGSGGGRSLPETLELAGLG